MHLMMSTTEPVLRPDIRRRLGFGLIISLLLHAVILCLQFGAPGRALPALGGQWGEPLQLHINAAPAASLAVMASVASAVPASPALTAASSMQKA